MTQMSQIKEQDQKWACLIINISTLTEILTLRSGWQMSVFSLLVKGFFKLFILDKVILAKNIPNCVCRFLYNPLIIAVVSLFTSTPLTSTKLLIYF